MFRKFLIAVVAALALASAASAQTYVRGYVRSNGTYVAPHYRSYSDGYFGNNWSTYGNYNPYTGAAGRRHYPSYGYGGYGRTGASGTIPYSWYLGW